MGFNHKISIKNFVVMEVCFREIGVSCNWGKIIVDRDTYDFAGILTFDKIIGHFKDGYYDIFYSGISIPITDVSDYTIDGYPIEKFDTGWEVPFSKTGDMEKDFSTGLLLEYGNSEYELKFGKFITDVDTVRRIVKRCQNLVEIRE